MKVIHLIVVALFTWMAVIQFNDPDPAYWVIVYTAVAWVAVLALFKRRNRPLMYVSFGMIFAGLLIATPGFIEFIQSGNYSLISAEMQDSKPYIESAREFIGLLIAATALTFYFNKRP